jgi:hypothetical protein
VYKLDVFKKIKIQEQMAPDHQIYGALHMNLKSVVNHIPVPSGTLMDQKQ